MIFKPELIELIQQGLKTQTRRPAEDGDTLDVDLVEGEPIPFGVIRKDRAKWQVDHLYMLQPGRAQKGVALIRITAIRQERLGDISEADALAEGFASSEAFLAYWERLYGKVDLGQPVWVLTFVYINVRLR